MMKAGKTLLVALDFGPQNEAVLSEALALADLLNATIHLLHVFTLQDKPERALMSRNAYTYFETAERSHLQAARARCRVRGQLGTVLWHEGDPAQQILLTASALGADMIMMGASSRRLLQRVRLGSVTEAVVRMAPCTVMVVRNTDKRGQAN